MIVLIINYSLDPWAVDSNTLNFNIVPLLKSLISDFYESVYALSLVENADPSTIYLNTDDPSIAYTDDNVDGDVVTNIANNILTISLSPNWSGTKIITITAPQSGETSVVNLTVYNVNELPIWDTPIVAQTLTYNTTITIPQLLNKVTDADDDTLIFTAESSNSDVVTVSTNSDNDWSLILNSVSLAVAGASVITVTVNDQQGETPLPTTQFDVTLTLVGADLSGEDLTNVNLTGIQTGSLGQLPTNAHLPLGYTGLDINNEKWIVGPGVNLTGANLTGADLSGVNLIGANLTDVNLTGANLTGANLTGVNLTGANLTGADLSGVNLIGANLTGANLTGVTLTGVTFSNGTNGANLTDVNLTGADLSGFDLTGVTLTGANLDNANLTGQDLNGFNLTGIILTRANLTNVNLTGQICDFLKLKLHFNMPL